MLRRVLLLVVFLLFSFNMTIAQTMTLQDVRVKITNTKQELDKLSQVEPKTPEISQKIGMLRDKLLNLKNIEADLLEQQTAAEPVKESESSAVISAPTSSSSTNSASSSSNVSPDTISDPNISPIESPGAVSTGADSGEENSISETLTQPTVMAAMISAFAVISTTLIGIFARRKG